MFLFAGNVHEAFFRSRSHKDCRGCENSSVFADYLFFFTVRDGNHFSVFVYSSEAGGMCEHIHGKLRAGFLQDAGPVADFIGFQQLASRRTAL